MIQGIKDKKLSFPYISHIIKDQFNENNNFLESKNEALSPLDDNLDELDLIDELQRLNIAEKMYRINSNVFFVSSRTTTNSEIDLDLSYEQDIYNYIKDFNIYHP